MSCIPHRHAFPDTRRAGPRRTGRWHTLDDTPRARDRPPRPLLHAHAPLIAVGGGVLGLAPFARDEPPKRARHFAFIKCSARFAGPDPGPDGRARRRARVPTGMAASVIRRVVGTSFAVAGGWWGASQAFAAAGEDDSRRSAYFAQLVDAARGLVTDPPRAMARFGHEWEGMVAVDELKTLKQRQHALIERMNAHIVGGSVPDAGELNQIQQSLRQLHDQIAAMRSEAVRKAAGAGHPVLGSDLPLEDARGIPYQGSLAGKVVGIYLTASWCAPCLRFTPMLQKAYETIRTSPGDTAFEVVQVSWDHNELGLKSYFRDHGLRWLRVPYSNRKAVESLSLRHDVSTIPALVIVEFDEDGVGTRVLSSDAKEDVALLSEGPHARRGPLPTWIRRVYREPPGAAAPP